MSPQCLCRERPRSPNSACRALCALASVLLPTDPLLSRSRLNWTDTSRWTCLSEVTRALPFAGCSWGSPSLVPFSVLREPCPSHSPWSHPFVRHPSSTELQAGVPLPGDSGLSSSRGLVSQLPSGACPLCAGPVTPDVAFTSLSCFPGPR